MRRLTTLGAVVTAASLLAGVVAAGPAAAGNSSEPTFATLGELAPEAPALRGPRATDERVAQLAAPVTAPGRLITGEPSRIIDTRDDGFGPVGPGLGEVAWFDYSELMGMGVTALVLNVTATRGSSYTSFVTVLDDLGGEATPTTSSLNASLGRDVANLVTVPLIGEGYVGLYNDQGWTHLVADLQAAYVASDSVLVGDAVTGGLVLTGAPDRVLDTRDTSPLGRNGYRDLRFEEAPAGAIAALATVTSTKATAGTSYISAWPYSAADPRPAAEVSILNAYRSSDIPNLAVLPLGDDATITLYNDQGSTHVIVDVIAWFVEDGGAEYQAITPRRATGSGWMYGTSELFFAADSAGNAYPDDATAVALNLTTSRATLPTYLTVYPTDSPARPAASSTNARVGADVATAAVTGATNGYTLYNNQGSVRALVDVVGYFAPTDR